MFTRQWLLGLKTSWGTISQCVSHRLVETRREMEKRLPQWTGWHTREPLTGECRVKWTCQPGGLVRAVVQCLYPRWVQFVVFSSSYRVSFKVAPSLILDHFDWLVPRHFKILFGSFGSNSCYVHFDVLQCILNGSSCCTLLPIQGKGIGIVSYLVLKLR